MLALMLIFFITSILTIGLDILLIWIGRGVDDASWVITGILSFIFSIPSLVISSIYIFG